MPLQSTAASSTWYPPRKSAPRRMRWGRSGSVRLPWILLNASRPWVPASSLLRSRSAASAPCRTKSAVNRCSCSNGLPSSPRSASSRCPIDASLRSVSRHHAGVPMIVRHRAWYRPGPVWRDRQSWMTPRSPRGAGARGRSIFVRPGSWSRMHMLTTLMTLPMTPESGTFTAGFPLARGGPEANTGPERQPVCATDLEPTSPERMR